VSGADAKPDCVGIELDDTCIIDGEGGIGPIPATKAAIAPDMPLVLYFLVGGPVQLDAYKLELAKVAFAIIEFIYGVVQYENNGSAGCRTCTLTNASRSGISSGAWLTERFHTSTSGNMTSSTRPVSLENPLDLTTHIC
jgi:hypothetical protein